MRLYENIFIVRPNLSPAQVEAIAEKFGNVVSKQGGNISKTEYCGLRHMAYPIKKNQKAHYVLMNVKAAPNIIEELERQMRLNEDVIRFLTISVDKHDTGPSVLMQQGRSQRESFGRSPREYNPGGEQPKDEELKTDVVVEEEASDE